MGKLHMLLAIEPDKKGAAEKILRGNSVVEWEC